MHEIFAAELRAPEINQSKLLIFKTLVFHIKTVMMFISRVRIELKQVIVLVLLLRLLDVPITAGR